MAFDCPFGFYITAKARDFWLFGIAAVLVALFGAAVFIYAYLNADTLLEKRLDLLLQVASGCVTVVALWLFKEAYKARRPANFLTSVCARLGSLHAPPATPEKSAQIEMLTTNGWTICNEP